MMNETIRNITARQSVRSYKADPLPKEAVDAILQAGLYAANSKGKQARHICVITNPDTIRELNDLVRSSSDLPGYDKYKPWTSREDYSIVFGSAPMFVIVSGDDTQSSSPMADCGLALGNMFAAAWSLGIGSCWINQLVPLSTEPAARAFFTKLGVPENYHMCGAACFGYPDGEIAPAAPRREGSWTVID